MKKIINLILFLSLTLFVNNCAGYKPIFGSSNIEFNISNYEITGNKKLGNKIYRMLKSISGSNKENTKNINFFINISKDKTATSKDTSGKILEYRITLNSIIKVKDTTTDNIIMDQTFITSITYKVQDQYSETVRSENSSLETLLNNTYQELLIRLSQIL